MNEICKPEICTGCSACADVCPKKCVVLKEDALGAMHPCIDESICVDCDSCLRVCPSLINEDLHSRAEEVYVAWSKEDETRKSSASGGLASELYRYAISNGYVTYGVTYSRELGAHFIEVKNEEDIQCVKNSKYVYSNAHGVYQQVKKHLADGEKVLFIGLPCQVSAVKRFVGKWSANLYLVDIICHGVAPTTYLQQHIEYIEKRKQKKADAISFRDPLYFTYTYTFTLKNDNEVFYKNTPKSRDVYQLGYHRALIYRENCYQCRFARAERIGDITIGDYSGLGRMGGYEGEHRNVSGFLCNSAKGKELKKQLEERCTFIQRPVDEIFKYEKQLNHPSVPHINRKLFLESYLSFGDYEQAAHKALSKDLFDVSIHRGEWKKIIKDTLRQFIPQLILEARRQK